MIYGVARITLWSRGGGRQSHQSARVGFGSARLGPARLGLARLGGPPSRGPGGGGQSHRASTLFEKIFEN